MSWIFDFYRSPMGRKAVMAVTGIVLFGFVVGHMMGNLKIYKGQEALDHYAEGLRQIGDPVFGPSELLWVARAGLLLCLVLHLHAAITLTQLNRGARGGQRYAKTTPQASTAASRSMIVSGVILLVFVVYHLLHLTIGTPDIHPNFQEGQVYHNVVTGLGSPIAAAFYVFANIALAFHLYHGVWSLFQTLGFADPRWTGIRQKVSLAFAILVAGVNISFPVAILTGFVKLGG